MDRRRTITLSVKDDFSRQLREYARGMDSANQATEQLGSRGSRSVLDMAQNLFYLGNSAKIVYGAFQQVLGTAQEWARMGAQAERSAYALRVYAGSAEEAERWTVAIQTAMRGTVTEGEAAAQAYMLMKFGLADSAEAAGEFARMLSVVAAANPQLGGTENALSQIQLTLANMSFMRLDQLGLSVDQVKRRMEELQRAMPGLSREAAFQEAVIEGLKEQADKLGEGMANVTLKQDQLNARSREFKERFGKTVNEALETGAGAALDLYDALVLLTSEPWTVVVNIAQATLDELTLPKVVEDSRNQFMTQPGLRGYAVDYPARGGVWQSMSNEEKHYYWMRAQTRMGGAQYREPEIPLSEQRARSATARSSVLWDWSANPRSIAEIMRGGGAAGFGLFWPEAQRRQQAELEQFRRYAAGMQGPPGIDWEGAFASMRRPTAESGGIWGRMAGLADEANAERAEKTANSLERITEAASKLSVEAQRAGKSLEEIWGIAPTAFDSSLYQKAGEALREYGVSAEKSEEAMRYMALATGETNAQSEIFALRANAAAEALERGEFGAADFAVQMGLLAREDWSWVDRLVRIPTDARGLEQYVQLIERLASGQIRLDDITQVTNTVQEGISRFQELVFGPQQEEDPLQPLKDSYDSLTAHAEQRWQNMESYMTAWVDLSTLQVRGWKESFVREIVDVETRLNTMTSRPWSVTITSSFTEGSAGTTTSSGRTLGGRAIPEFQRGGYTGDGPPGQIAGVVHRGEYVLSQDMLRKMRQGQRAPDFPRMGPMIGGGGGGVTITGPIHVHGVQNAAQLLGELKREAARKNTRLVEAMS